MEGIYHLYAVIQYIEAQIPLSLYLLCCIEALRPDSISHVQTPTAIPP